MDGRSEDSLGRKIKLVISIAFFSSLAELIALTDPPAAFSFDSAAAYDGADD